METEEIEILEEDKILVLGEELLTDLPTSTADSVELYNCNSCNISFVSIADHVKQFHNGEEVVIEMENVEGAIQKVVNNFALVDMLDKESSDVYKECVENNCITVQSYKSVIVKNDTLAQDTIEIDGDSTILNEVNDDKNDKSEPSIPAIQIFKCLNCKGDFSSVDDKNAHKCAPTKIYKCRHCNLTYNNPKSFCAHLKVHKPKEVKRPNKNPNDELAEPSEEFECEICLTRLVSNKSLSLHKRMHNLNKLKFEEPIAFPTNASQSIANSDEVYHCSECDKWLHVDFRCVHDRIHNGIAEYNCIQCNKKLSNEESLNMHMKVHDKKKLKKVVINKKSLYKCNYCPRQFKRPYEKVKHERIHTGEKPYKCDICNKTFRVSHCLTLHLRTHTGARPYECEICTKKFKSHSVYNHHMLLHSEVRAYKCPFCPKAFKTSVQLAGHKNSHTKPFSCKECNRPFSSLYAVRMHMESHKKLNNLRYKCWLCGASYVRSFALKEHLKDVHSYETDRDLVPEDDKAIEFILPD